MEEKREQRRARIPHSCEICGKEIVKKWEYIALSRHDAVTGRWFDFSRHIHCDALVRFYAEKMQMDPENICAAEMRGFMDYLCDVDCLPGIRQTCRQDPYACMKNIWLLRNRPGYGAVFTSAEQCNAKKTEV